MMTGPSPIEPRFLRVPSPAWGEELINLAHVSRFYPTPNDPGSTSYDAHHPSGQASYHMTISLPFGEVIKLLEKT